MTHPETTDELAPLDTPSAGQLARLRELADHATDRAASAMAGNTGRAYDAQWRRFAAWCSAHGLGALPADGRIVALYLASMDSEGLAVATMSQALAAIVKAHRKAELAPPSGRALEDTWAGIRRERGVAPSRKAPVTAEDLARMVEVLAGDRLINVRDRALLLVGFAGAFRRSELAALQVEDLSFEEGGVVVHLRRSKTDQEGAGRDVGIPHQLGRGLHPVAALRTWLERSGITSGPVFRTVNQHGQLGTEPLAGNSIARIVKRAAMAVGLDPARFAGHSLRAGLVTSAARAGKQLPAIMAQTGHRSVATVQKYIRRATLFEDNAATDLL